MRYPAGSIRPGRQLAGTQARQPHVRQYEASVIVRLQFSRLLAEREPH